MSSKPEESPSKMTTAQILAAARGEEYDPASEPQQTSSSSGSPVCSCKTEMKFLGRSKAQTGDVIAVFDCESCERRVFIHKDSLYLGYFPCDCCGELPQYVGADSRHANEDGSGVSHGFTCRKCGIPQFIDAVIPANKPLPAIPKSSSRPWWRFW